mgnify:CR=1 FL=1
MITTWQGNMTLKMNGKEDTYSPGPIEVKKYAENAIALKFTEKDGRASALVRMSRADCKALITELVESL